MGISNRYCFICALLPLDDLSSLSYENRSFSDQVDPEPQLFTRSFSPSNLSNIFLFLFLIIRLFLSLFLELPEITESFELETVAGNSTRNVDETSDDSKESRTSEELLEGEARHSMDALVRDGPLQLVPSVELIVDITDSHSLGDQFVSSDQIISEIENVCLSNP